MLDIVLQFTAEKLDLNTLLNLVVVSKKIKGYVAPTIESTYRFNIPNGKKLIFMAPKIVKVVTEESIPTSATHVFIGKHFHCPGSFYYRFSLPSYSFKSSLIFPPSVTHLSIKKCIFGFTIPASVTSLDILDDGKFCLSENFPSSLTHLKIRYPPANMLISPFVTYTYNKSKNKNGNVFLSNLTSLEYHRTTLAGAILPDSLIHLKFGGFFNEPLSLPPRLVVLDVGNKFSQKLDNLPSSLRELYVGTRFTGPLNSLPSNLTRFAFGDGLVHCISCLPLSLTHLTLGNGYNHPLPSLPLLVYLELGNIFNQELPSLPELETLKCGKLFDKSIDFCASSLRFLTLGRSFNRVIPYFPNLYSLDFSGEHLQFEEPDLCTIKRLIIACPGARVESLPQSLNYLTMDSVVTTSIIDEISQSVSELHFMDDFDHPVEHLPRSLTHLYFGKMFNQHVDQLPSTVMHLSFGLRFNQPVDNLPLSLLSLKFGQNFNQKVDHLPSRLTHLRFGDEFNQSIANLPHSITHLQFGSNFRKDKSATQTIKSWAVTDPLPLPPHLTHLTFSNNFNKKIPSYPSTLTHICFGYKYNKSLKNLPPSIVSIRVGYDFDLSVHPCPHHLKGVKLSRIEFYESRL